MPLASPFGRTARVRRIVYRGHRRLAAGNPEAAEATARRALTLRKPGGGAEIVVAALELQAAARRQLCDFRAAAALHQQALKALTKATSTPPDQHRTVWPDTVADSYRLECQIRLGLGDCQRLLGLFPAAEAQHRHAVSLAERVTPSDQLLLAWALNGLGIVFKDTHRYDAAGQCYHRALALAQDNLGHDHPQLSTLYHNLAGLDHARQRFDDAEPVARRALQLSSQRTGRRSEAAAADMAVLGAVLLGRGDLTEAEQLLTEARNIWQSHYGPMHYEVGVATHNLAALHAARGDHRAARAAYQQTAIIKEAVLGAGHPDTLAVRRHLSQLAPV